MLKSELILVSTSKHSSMLLQGESSFLPPRKKQSPRHGVKKKNLHWNKAPVFRYSLKADNLVSRVNKRPEELGTLFITNSGIE